MSRLVSQCVAEPTRMASAGDGRSSDPRERIEQGSAFRREGIARPNGRVNEPWVLGIRLDLLPQASDGVVHGAGPRRIRVFPDLLQQFFATDHVTGAFGEILQQIEFAMCQMDLRITPLRRSGNEIDSDRPDDEIVSGRARPSEYAWTRATNSSRSNGFVM